MSDTLTVSAASTEAPRLQAQRVASIDIFRGLTMMVMIFVNHLSSVGNLPWWTYHATAEQNVMTYVDMVFPFFLFAVGLSMPLAIERRLAKNPSQADLWRHIALRAAGLVVLGLILANADYADAARMGISQDAWLSLGLVGGVFFWLVPGRDARYRNVYRGLRILGLLMLVATFAIFRRTTAAGNVAWIEGSYPEILGLIGYSYFAVALLYVPTRRWRWMPLAWFAALTALCALQTAHVIKIESLPLYVWPFGSGAFPSMIMAGIVTSNIMLQKDSSQSLRQKMGLALAFAMVTLAAGWLLAPLGISKLRGTPTWCLASMGASVLAFMLLYWICDVHGKTGWARFVESAGDNTLLTYLLPDLYEPLAALLGFTLLSNHYTVGAAGVIRSVVFTGVILLVSAGLTRARIRLQL